MKVPLGMRSYIVFTIKMIKMKFISSFLLLALHAT